MKASVLCVFLKAAEAAAKQTKNEERSRSKGASAHGKRTKSASPGKKKGKKDDAPPSPKKDTKLKRRGELEDTFKTIGMMLFSSIYIHCCNGVFT